MNTQYPQHIDFRRPMHLLIVAIVLLLVCIPLFLHLDKLPIRLWDESRLAMNAYEMHKNGNLIVTHYEGEPDMWNTKPPMMIWLQLIFIKIIGFSELALRLPAAIAGLLTCAFMVIFAHKYFRNYLPGVFASIVLVTINGYVDQHAIRTGDYDGLLALFSTAFVLCSFMYAEHKNEKWLLLFFIALTFAVLTKSVQPLLFIPGILIYYLLNRKFNLFIQRTFLLGAMATVFIVASYYVAREQYNKGYLETIWLNELGGRYFSALEENYAGPGFYAGKMIDYYMPYWIWLLPVAFVGGFVSRSTAIRNLTLFNFIITASYFILISISKTKLLWYTVPLFPFFSLQTGIFIYQVYDYLLQILPKTKFQILPLIVVSCVFAYPYLKIGRKVYNPSEYSWDNMYPISNLLRDAFHNRTSLNNHVIVYKDYDQHLRIYLAALKDKGQNIQLKDPARLVIGDTVIASEQEVFKVIEERYDVRLLRKQKDLRIYIIQ